MTICMMKGRAGPEVQTKCGRIIKSPVNDRKPGWTSRHHDVTCPDCLAAMKGTP